MQQQSSDAELLHAMKHGDAGAFKALYDKYWEPLYLKACRRVDKDEAKDLVQEVMTTLWRRRNDISTSADGEIGRYLFTAVKYRVITHYAYTAAEIRNSHLFDALTDEVTANSLEVRELSELIESEIRRLPVRMQQVFRMSREDDLSIADIASRLGLSEQTVKNQLTEALKRLRASISSRDNGDWVFILILLLYYSPN
ncbi:MAG: sigma-70 family RNA polymerase sigma factor [Chitinophagaceae bacterium]|nr:sigma-70 family RNA polymerase sigma factor [Chitinophagaceae bacterium]